MKYNPIPKPNISEHVSYEDATRSFVGVPNTPGIKELIAMKYLSSKIYEPLVTSYDPEIRILSFYRNKAVNAAERGHCKSDHCKGIEMDITCTENATHTNAELFEYILTNLPYHELRWDCSLEDPRFSNESPPWIHVSLNIQSNMNAHKAYREYIADNGKLERNRCIRDSWMPGLSQSDQLEVLQCGSRCIIDSPKPH